jgi:methylglutaconyl-CoA hydratase
MSDALVLHESRLPAAVLTLNRPERRNALSRALVAALGEAVARAAADPAVRCLVLTGAGAAFCAGLDLAELQESVSAPPPNPPPPAGGGQGGGSPVWQDALRLAEVYDRIYTCPKPVVAAVNGPAVAGGAGLVSVCDLAAAAPEATFGYPEVRRGLVAAIVMPHLLRHVGERAARWLLLTGEMIGAEEARRTGFVNAVTPSGRVVETALQWARSVAEGGPEALARTKELLHGFSRQAVGLEEASRASAAPRLSDECRRGLEAFFAKRPAPWAPEAADDGRRRKGG